LPHAQVPQPIWGKINSLVLDIITSYFKFDRI
jgi:hypothetical protein